MSFDFKQYVRELGMAGLEAIYDFCPTREDGLCTLDNIVYELAAQGEDYINSYNSPVFRTERRQ